ncbi:MAG: YicC family protein [Balneolaceae bacterium]|nr:MAG: YicC family protein [Balneolaceae bacterium]
MTGFGRGEASSNGFQVTVEVKTLNSRYLDISSRMPQIIQQHEFSIKEIVQKKLSRGKVHLIINVENMEKTGVDVTYNEELVKAYGTILENIRSAANIQQPVQLQDIFQFDGIFKSKEEDKDEIEMIWNCTANAIDLALDNLNEMRNQEGEELKNDLANQIKGIADIVKEVEKLSENRVPEVREKLQTRINNLLSDDQIDPERLELEIALIADKMDINEEIIRLNSHLKFFLKAFSSDNPVGRRLNFLSQEINRELNTIGSKANDSTISQHIVLGKEKLEQIREQVQNVE